MLTPEVSDSVADISIVKSHIHKMVVKLERYPVAPPDLIYPDMIDRRIG